MYYFNEDICDIIFSYKEGVSDEVVVEYICKYIFEYDVLLVGFFCQLFLLVGVLKKNLFGWVYGFVCDIQGMLFFDVVCIIDVCCLVMFVFENVKNLKSYDQGKMFCIIMQMLDELGYDVVDVEDNGLDDLKIIDGKYFLLQYCECIVLVGFCCDFNLKVDFILCDISECFFVQ